MSSAPTNTPTSKETSTETSTETGTPTRASRRAAATVAAAKPLDAAKTPVGVGPISILGPILAVLALAAGGILVRDALVWFGIITGPAWTSKAAWSVNGMTPQGWLIPVSIAAVLLGLWLLMVGLRRRPRTGIALAADTGVFLRPVDVARLARARAEDVNGVLHATANATRRTVTVTVTSTNEGDDVSNAVQQAVTDRVSALASAPTVRVRVKGASS